MLVKVKSIFVIKKSLIYFAAICMMLSSTTFAQKKEETIKVSKGGSLSIRLIVGDIKISTWDKDEINLKYESDEDEDIGQLVINRDNNNIEVTSSSNYYIDEINITMPEKFNLEVSTTAGDIKINGDVNGKVKIKTSGGDIKLENIDSDAELKTDGGDIRTGKVNGNAQISTSGGDLRIGSVTGEAVIKTSGGSISVGNIGKRAELKTAGGNVYSKNIGGDAEITSGGGNIDAGEISGNAELKTGGGNINIEKANGKVSAKSGAGNINLKNVYGSVNAYSGAGEISVALFPGKTGESDIKTSSGGITLYIPGDAKVTVDAKTSSVSAWGNNDSNDIISDFQASETENRHSKSHKVYKINGGGNIISLRAVFGTIKILKIK